MATLTEALINAGLSSAQANVIAARFSNSPPSTQAFQEALILAGVDAEAAVLLAANIGAVLPEGAVGAASFDSQGQLLNQSGEVVLTGAEIAGAKAVGKKYGNPGGFTIGAIGNSIAAFYGENAGLAAGSFQATSTGAWAAAATCGLYRVDLPSVYGYGGQNSQYIASQISTWVNFADETFLHLYENDITGGLTLQQIEQYTDQIINALLGKTKVKLCSCLPNTSFTTTAHRDKFNAVNAMAFRKARQYGLKYINVSDLWVDTAVGNGIPSAIAGYVDTVHPRVGAAQLLAYQVLAPSLDFYSASFFNSFGSQGTGKQNMLPNSWFSATQAASGANITGTVPALWEANIYLPSGSTGSLTCSMRQRSDRVSAQNWCDLRYQSDKGSFGDFALQIGNYSWTTGDFVAGDVVECLVDFEVTGTPIGLQSIDLRVNFPSAAKTLQSAWGGYVNAQNPCPWAAPKGTIRTQRYVLTQADITAGYLNAYCKCIAISALTPVDATVGFANPRIIKVA